MILNIFLYLGIAVSILMIPVCLIAYDEGALKGAFVFFLYAIACAGFLVERHRDKVEDIQKRR